MNTLTRLFLVLFSFVIISVMLVNCSPCDCSWVKLYFDFNVKRFIGNNVFYVTDTAKFYFVMDKTYCNEKEIQSSCLSVINNAQACQCFEEGSRGERDSLIEINIWSRPKFNDQYDIKDNIKSLFNIILYDTRDDSTCSRFVDFGQLDNFNGFKRDTTKFYGFQKKNCIILKLKERPKLVNQDYLFWFEFKYKSGRKQLMKSQRINWIERIN